MTWFTLPATHSGNKAAFADTAGAAAWLAQQPQANTAVMQSRLLGQIQALNTSDLPPRERFKILEVLRNTLFTIDTDGHRRFENRPIPLWSSEQAALDMACQLWRACATAYLHCLRACLDGDPDVAELKARIAHRALVCLRKEQQNDYLGMQEAPPDFWGLLHSLWASAEELGVTSEPVADRLLGETSESTINGQYAMTLLLHLARPFELSRSQFSAVTRWLARWREQAEILPATGLDAKSPGVALDLSLSAPTAAAEGTPGRARWLSTGNILRKIRKRVASLEAGESPEGLKLGSSISSKASISLLKHLAENLKNPLPINVPVPANAPLAKIAVGLEAIYRQLGGKRLKAAEELTSMSRQAQEQIAIFGQAREEAPDKNAVKPEDWLIVEHARSTLRLIRPAGKGQSRLNNKCLISLQLPDQPNVMLACLSSLCTRSDGSVHAVASIFPGAPAALVAEVRERPTGKISRHPAFLLPGNNALGTPTSICLPAGMATRALSVSLLRDPPVTVRLSSCLDHGSDYEQWIYEAS